MNERGRYKGVVFEDIEEVKRFFGHGWLAKELYHNAGIEDVVDID